MVTVFYRGIQGGIIVSSVTQHGFENALFLSIRELLV
jgi:hypothetical protein